MAESSLALGILGFRMGDLELDSAHDLNIKNLDFNILDKAESIRQQLLIKLKLWKGEWFLDTDFGTPYIQEILGKQLTLSGAIAAIRKSILEVGGVRQILSFSYSFNNSNRKLSIQFSADTEYGLLEVTI